MRPPCGNFIYGKSWADITSFVWVPLVKSSRHYFFCAGSPCQVERPINSLHRHLGVANTRCRDRRLGAPPSCRCAQGTYFALL